MGTQLSIENFEEIYHATYHRTLRYIVCKCSNVEDVNDILQETYVELYRILQKRKTMVLNNYQNYIIGIAKKKMQKHYGLLYTLKNLSIFLNSDAEEYEINLPSTIDVETDTITKLDVEKVWDYIKQKKVIVMKVFYLYYYSDMKISQIAKELNISESKVKNILYRTIKEIKEKWEKEGDRSV